MITAGEPREGVIPIPFGAPGILALLAQSRAFTVTLACFLSISVLTPDLAGGAPPTVDYLFPSGAQQGTTVRITAGAKLEPSPAKAWTDHPGLTIEPADKPGEFVAKVAKDCPLGPHLVRMYNEQGASALHEFLVDRHPEVLEQEPNDAIGSAQQIDALPAIINGQLERPGDDDCFAFNVEAGRWIVAELTCHRLGSPIDPAMHLYGPDGVEVAFNHDTFGLDPLVAWRAKKSGRYVIQVIGFQFPPGVDVRFAGSKAAVYRLLVTTGPYARYAFPAGVQRGTKAPLHLFGWNLGTSGESLSLDFDASHLGSVADRTLICPPFMDNAISIPVGDVPEQLEIEPNDAQDSAQPIAVPSIINGRIDHGGDVDRFGFSATRGERLTFAIQSASLDFPLDAVMSIEDAAGKTLTTSDDVGPSHDPRLDWTAPAEGKYFAAISDRYGSGGPQYVYRLQVSHPTASFTAITDTSAVRVEPGKSVELPVTVTRINGHALPLAILLDGLPAGVSSTTAAVPPSGGAVKVRITAEANALPANQPIRAIVVSLDPDHPLARTASIDLGADRLIHQSEAIWLTVPPIASTTKPSETNIHKD